MLPTSQKVLRKDGESEEGYEAEEQGHLLLPREYQRRSRYLLLTKQIIAWVGWFSRSRACSSAKKSGGVKWLEVLFTETL